MIDLGKILFPTDFSTCSKGAKLAAHDLARRFESELHVLHVVPDPAIELPEFMMGLSFPSYVANIGPNRRMLREKALNHLESEIPDSWKNKHRVALDVRIGHASTEITKYASENEIDLIVIGSHGRTGMSHALLGSVAESTVRNAPCPVLTIRPSEYSDADDQSKVRFPWGIHPLPVG